MKGCIRRPRGLTLIEMMVAISLFGVFLAVSYQPLLKVMAHPRWSQRVFRDRNAAMVAERSLVNSVKSTVDGYLWTTTSPSETMVLLGQAKGYQGKSVPVTSYTLFHYDKNQERLFRAELTLEQLQEIAGTLTPGATVSPQAWERLGRFTPRSIVANHIVGFLFDPGVARQPITLEIEVSSIPVQPPATRENIPSRKVRRLLGKVVHEE